MKINSKHLIFIIFVLSFLWEGWTIKIQHLIFKKLFWVFYEKNGPSNTMFDFQFFWLSMRTMGHQNTTFDFRFCLEFAMRTMGHQNTTFYFQFYFVFVMRMMGHHVARCSDDKNKVRSQTIFESWWRGPVFS